MKPAVRRLDVLGPWVVFSMIVFGVAVLVASSLNLAFGDCPDTSPASLASFPTLPLDALGR